MKRHRIIWGMIVTFIVVLGYVGASPVARASEASVGILPETVANYLHAVIEADRTFYMIHVVERLQNKGVVTASEQWRVKDTLPLPAQFLLESSNLSALTGAKFRYRLMGFAPLNPQNGPATEFERAGLDTVRKTPGTPYTGTNDIDGQRYFQAIYADWAVSQACVDCHNGHPDSPKKDFKLNDVMGAIIISIPLEK